MCVKHEGKFRGRVDTFTRERPRLAQSAAEVKTSHACTGYSSSGWKVKVDSEDEKQEKRKYSPYVVKRGGNSGGFQFPFSRDGTAS